MTEVHTAYEELRGILNLIDPAKEPSSYSAFQNQARKILVMSAGSYFEHKVVALLEEFASNRSSGCEELVSFARNKALKRQYHTLFDWEKTNGTNQFFGLFGKAFKEKAAVRMREDERAASAATAFIEIGSMRNRLAHQNFAAYIMEKDLTEIFQLFETANNFLGFLSSIFEMKKEHEEARNV